VKYIYIGETLDRLKNQKLGIGGNGEKKKPPGGGFCKAVKTELSS
jgi:hypothetical protein